MRGRTGSHRARGKRNFVPFLSLSTKIVELQLRLGGLNEADSGKPEVVDMWRISQGMTKQLGH